MKIRKDFQMMITLNADEPFERNDWLGYMHKMRTGVYVVVHRGTGAAYAVGIIPEAIDRVPDIKIAMYARLAERGYRLDAKNGHQCAGAFMLQTKAEVMRLGRQAIEVVAAHLAAGTGEDRKRMADGPLPS